MRDVRHRYYKLIGKLAVPCDDLKEWGEQLTDVEGRRVGREIIHGFVEVSTVFLGFDHEWREGADPMLFETMIFDKAEALYCDRCSTWAEAEQMHADAIEWVKENTDARFQAANLRALPGADKS